MSFRRGTIWPINPQTIGKHLILREYLNAWIPILGQGNSPRIAFIDGFAGPGLYSDGEDGSPIIALKAFEEHPAAARITADLVFLFIEKDPKRRASLQSLIDARPANPRMLIQVVEGSFDVEVTALLDRLEAKKLHLVPAFVMMDPFGVSDTPMAIVRRIFRHPSSEVFISFMARDINRFLNHESNPEHFDALFGCPEWRAVQAIPEYDDRKQALYELYERQLRDAGAEYVLRFELFKGGELIYAIFFATKHPLGCEKMKDAIWKVVPMGDFIFRGNRTGTSALELAVTDTRRLRKDLRDKFGDAWTAIEDVIRFMQTDGTLFRVGQLKRDTLAPMEREGVLEARGPRKRGQFPDGTEIRFLPLQATASSTGNSS